MENRTEEKIVPIKTSNLAAALSNAQGVMTGAKKDKKNPFFKSSYADLASVFDVIREPFAANGLAITQTMDFTPDGHPILLTRLMHVSGEFFDSKMLLPAGLDPQKLGSTITYYRRYSLMAIAGIPAEDDDGNGANDKPAPVSKLITEKQVADLEALINGHSDIRELVLNNCKQNMATITIDRYPGAVQWITKLIEEKGETND